VATRWTFRRSSLISHYEFVDALDLALGQIVLLGVGYQE
jgi:hypothetical protein